MRFNPLLIPITSGYLALIVLILRHSISPTPLALILLAHTITSLLALVGQLVLQRVLTDISLTFDRGSFSLQPQVTQGWGNDSDWPAWNDTDPWYDPEAAYPYPNSNRTSPTVLTDLGDSNVPQDLIDSVPTPSDWDIESQLPVYVELPTHC